MALTISVHDEQTVFERQLPATRFKEKVDEVTFGEVIGSHRSRHGSDSHRVHQRISGWQHR
jgi:hypothetical protein